MQGNKEKWRDMLGPDYAGLGFPIMKFRFCLHSGEPLKVLSRSATQ